MPPPRRQRSLIEGHTGNRKRKCEKTCTIVEDQSQANSTDASTSMYGNSQNLNNVSQANVIPGKRRRVPRKSHK